MDYFLKHAPVEFVVSGHEAGRCFAEATSAVQKQFLGGLCDAVATFTGAQSWPQQCRYIADHFPPLAGREQLIGILRTLVEHLEEQP